jgi:hypothetical protein
MCKCRCRVSYRRAIEDQNQSTCYVANCAKHDNSPYQYPVHVHRGARDEAQVAEAKGGLESGDTELVEWSTCIVELGSLVSVWYTSNRSCLLTLV